MTRLLLAAIAEVEKLTARDQDAIAFRILEEIGSERRWAALFVKNPEVLARLAEEALEERRLGKTQELDPENNVGK